MEKTSLALEQGRMSLDVTFSWLRLRLKRCCGILHSWSAQAFRTLGLIPSRPAALFCAVSPAVSSPSCWYRQSGGGGRGDAVFPDRGGGVDGAMRSQWWGLWTGRHRGGVRVRAWETVGGEGY